LKRLTGELLEAACHEEERLAGAQENQAHGARQESQRARSEK
jgi:hypothetical protein